MTTVEDAGGDLSHFGPAWSRNAPSGGNMRGERLTSAAVVVIASLTLANGAASCKAGTDSTSYRFDFGTGKVATGYLQVVPSTVHGKEPGYGFDLGSTVTAVDRGGDDPLRDD